MDLETLRDFLRRPQAHPEGPGRVEVIETHFALVFVTDTVVRKLKKPIRTAWLDFSTLEKRRAAARREVALNRPLAPDVYLGTEEVVVTGSGALAIARPGQAVDVLVAMRRLPAARTLERAMPRVTPAALAPVAERLAGFYGESAEPGDAKARLEQISSNLEDLRRRLLAGPLHTRSSAIEALFAFRAEAADRLAARVATARIVDAHGDLRPEHVYLTDQPAILDRLEFAAALRRIDWLEDLALLAVDLERQRRSWIGEWLKRSIAWRLGDRPPLDLWCFYRSWRALLRAQLAVEHLARPDHRPREHWLGRARAYLAIADRHAGRLNPRAGRGSSGLRARH